MVWKVHSDNMGVTTLLRYQNLKSICIVQKLLTLHKLFSSCKPLKKAIVLNEAPVFLLKVIFTFVSLRVNSAFNLILTSKISGRSTDHSLSISYMAIQNLSLAMDASKSTEKSIQILKDQSANAWIKTFF